MPRKDNIHIEILKYGLDKIEKSITFDDLKRLVKELGYEIPESILLRYLMDGYECNNPNGAENFARAVERGYTFSLSIESTFRLLEYEELQEARESSRKATWLATSALGVSILIALISIGFSVAQLYTTTTITKSQIDKVINSKYDDRNISAKLSDIIKNQKTLIKKLNSKVK